MEEENTWTNLFFSGNRPEFAQDKEINAKKEFRPFRPEVENWILRELADESRLTNEKHIQVFWLWIDGRKKYVGKVFPDYTEEQAAEQLYRLGWSSQNPQLIDDAVHEFDRFCREARAYSHIDRFCSAEERIYFPNFYGVVTDMQRSRFASGYAHPRAIVLEAVKPNLCSRRVLGEHTSQLPEDFSDILTDPPLSPFERGWYCSLLKDRLRRLGALHREMSRTLSSQTKPRPLKRISKGEHERAKNHRPRFRSHLIKLSSQHTVDDALWQSLDKEEELLELVIFKVYNRPDYFSMPTLNSIFPFLETVRPDSDPCWHIRRGRLLHHYKSVWAVCNENQLSSIIFDDEAQFKTERWIKSLRATHDSSSKDTGFDYKLLREACLLLVSSRCPGYVYSRGKFLGIGNKERYVQQSESM
ncbi:hypothetical protein BJX99DRAFT_248202 [Aspergillus californicus]